MKAVSTALSAIGIAAIAWFVWQGYEATQTSRPSGPVVAVQVSPVIIKEVKRVKKEIFVEHYSAVDVTYGEAPASWFDFLNKIGIRQHYVVLLRGRVPAGFDLDEISEGDIWVSPDGSVPR